MLEILKAVLIGIVQGITEWLPISSTGHMILFEHFVKFQSSPEFMEMFRVMIQLGSIMAVLLLYFHKLNPFSPKKTVKERRGTIDLWVKVLIASMPAAVIGLLFDDLLDQYLYNYVIVALTLIIYGVLFIVVENRHQNKNARINTFKQLTYRDAIMIGAFQVLALIPGTSRSGATIMGAILIGTSRLVATEFSFFLAIPVMFGASLLKLVKFGFGFTLLEFTTLFTGMFVAFVVSLFAIRFLIGYLKKNDFKVFGYYRIVLGILVLLIFLIF